MFYRVINTYWTYVCFIDRTEAYDSVDRTLLWTVLADFVVPQKVISVIRQFEDDM